MAGRPAEPAGRSVSPDLKAAIDAATAFTRESALMIATMPVETRGIAYHIAQYKLAEALRRELGDTDISRKLVRSQLADIRELVAKIDASGGAVGGRA
jgi:hypothetical protein